MLRPGLVAAICCIVLAAGGCGSGSDHSTDANAAHEFIRVNQLGFAPESQKLAVVSATDEERFTVVDARSGDIVYSGQLGAVVSWPESGESVRQADFSELRTLGEYQVYVDGLPESDRFFVEHSPYDALHKAAMRAYYYNRASQALLPVYAGKWSRAAGHPDTDVQIHASAASQERPEGSSISAPKGWYDAGDYGKYIVNSGISTYTLLAALEHFPALHNKQRLNIPESKNAVPDLLDEVLWNLEWMLAMQDPHDGGVYHKLTTKQFAGAVMPEEAHAQRYVVQKGTAAALNFTAVMAVASRVLADYENEFPGKSQQMLNAAMRAWQWAEKFPNVPYKQPADIGTGAYGDDNFSDEFAWAAAELYITTGDEAFYRKLDASSTPNAAPSWGQSLGLAWMSLAHHQNGLSDIADKELIKQRVMSLADEILQVGEESGYAASMREQDFVWGSNGVAMNRAMMLLQAHKMSGDRAYLDGAQSLLDYVLGRNPTGYSYVTGFGERPPMHIHHRQSQADEVKEPVPGFLVGGPRGQKGEDCAAYPSRLPAKAYLDDWCSYSTNEVTINWNAPLVYVISALSAAYAE